MSDHGDALQAYLVRLAVDQQFRDAAQVDPDTSFDGFSLSEEHKAHLRSPGPEMLALIGQVLHQSGRFKQVAVGDQERLAGAVSAAPPQTVDDLMRLERPQRIQALLSLVKRVGYRPAQTDDNIYPKHHITVVGLGIKNLDHLTREAAHAIQSANEVLYVDTGVATHEYLEGHCSNVTSLYAQSYAEGHSRTQAYEYMAARTLDAALEHSPVVFAIQGHPLIFCQPPFLIRNTAKALGLNTRILPGISAIDTVACDLGIDPCTAGLQMYEATDLLLRKRPLQTDVPALIWQVGTVESRLHTSRVSDAKRFYRFQSYLQGFYPDNHPVIAVYSSTFATMPPTRYNFRVDEICAYSHLLHPGVTLYLPAATQRPIQDEQLREAIDDPRHLNHYVSPSDEQE